MARLLQLYLKFLLLTNLNSLNALLSIQENISLEILRDVLSFRVDLLLDLTSIIQFLELS